MKSWKSRWSPQNPNLSPAFEFITHFMKITLNSKLVHALKPPACLRVIPHGMGEKDLAGLYQFYFSRFVPAYTRHLEKKVFRRELPSHELAVIERRTAIWLRQYLTRVYGCKM
jgi:hypothetical protein